MPCCSRLFGAVTAAVTALVLAGCGSDSTAPVTGETVTSPTTPSLPQQLPGLGPRTLARVPGDAGQVVLVTGVGADSALSTVVVYQRTAAGWLAGAFWPAHNGLDGWTDHETAYSRRSPAGVFTLTDAGGLLPNPGTRMPYHQSDDFTVSGTGFEGEPLAGSFDYVVAINYNRVPGTSPLDPRRPLGVTDGGGIWLHVDHDGPTQGCVSLPLDDMVTLLHTLDPARNPVIVMGDSAALAT